MSVVIACPSCGIRLGVGEDLLGQTVRCASCGHTFPAQTSPEIPDPASYDLVDAPEPAPPRRPSPEYEDQDADWRGRRRDYEPHRGSAILTCGILSIVCGLLGLACCQLFSIIGLALGGLAVVWGSADLKAMRADRMDPAGEGSINAGWICGLVGLILSALGFLFLVVILIVYGVMAFTGNLR